MTAPQTIEDAIATVPTQPSEGWDLASGCTPKGKFTRIVFAGMGGSALGAELLLAGSQFPVPARLVRDYTLPEADKRTLVLAISYSGNTEETLSAFQEARSRGCGLAVLAHGGALLAEAEKAGIPAVRIPECPQPRYSFGYQLGALARILHNVGLGPDLSAELKALRALKDNNAKQRADVMVPQLLGTVPIFYSSERYRALARLCTIKLAENAKLLSFHNTFPEMNHNEMTGYQNSRKQARFHALILRDAEDHPRILKRYAVTTRVLHDCGAAVTVTNLRGSSFWEKCIDFSMVADWLSLALAKANDVDPLPVPLVEELKQRLKA